MAAYKTAAMDAEKERKKMWVEYYRCYEELKEMEKGMDDDDIGWLQEADFVKPPKNKTMAPVKPKLKRSYRMTCENLGGKILSDDEDTKRIKRTGEMELTDE